jgi:hypothetical protein
MRGGGKESQLDCRDEPGNDENGEKGTARKKERRNY